MIHNLRAPSSYNRQYDSLVNDLHLQINNEQATMAAVQGRLSGNPTAGTEGQQQDRRSVAEKRLDLTYQTSLLRINLLKIMDSNEAGITIQRIFNNNRNPLTLITTINQQWNGIQTDIKKVYTDVSPTIFLEFVTEYLSSPSPGRQGTDLVGSKGRKATLIDNILRSCTTFHIGLDNVINRLRGYFQAGGKVTANYTHLAEDFRLIAVMKAIVPLPNQRTRELLTSFTNSMLEQIYTIMSIFPTLQQVNELIYKYFNRNENGRLNTGYHFENLMRDVFTLFFLTPPMRNTLINLLQVDPADIARLPSITATGNIDRDTTLAQDYITQGDDILHPLGDVEAMTSYPPLPAIADAVLPATLPASTTPVDPSIARNAAASAAAMGPPIPLPASIIQPFDWYEPAGGWTFSPSSGTISQAEWEDYINELEAPLLTKAPLLTFGWSQSQPSQRNTAFLVTQYNLRYQWPASVDQNAVKNVLGLTTPPPTLFDSFLDMEQQPNGDDLIEQFNTEIQAGYDADPTTSTVGSVKYSPYEWFAPPILLSDGSIIPGYDGDKISWSILSVPDIKTTANDVLSALGPIVPGFGSRERKASILNKIKEAFDNDPTLIQLSETQQTQANYILLDTIRTSFELSAYLESNGSVAVAPYDLLYPQLITGYAATLTPPAAPASPTPAVVAAAAAAAPAPTSPIPTVAAAPDEQADLGVTGNPDLENILSAPLQPGGEQPGEVVGSGTARAARVGNRRTRIIMGKGINPYFVPSGGIEQVLPPRYAVFGRKYLNVEKLNNGKICIKSRATNGEYKSVDGLPNQNVSGPFVTLIKELITNKTFNYVTFIKLQAHEKELMGTIVDRCALPIQLPVEDTDYERFELLKGHILSGGNNREELREFKQLLFKFVRLGRLGHKQALSIVEELSDL